MAELNQGHVLIVDDSEMVLMVLEASLSEHGWDMSTAMSGRAAIETIRHSACDVVVLDLHMPDMDGYEVLHEIKLVNSDVPVIMHSVDDDVNAVLGAVQRGAFDYVLKSGVSINPLVAAMDRAVAHHRVVLKNKHMQADLRVALTRITETAQTLAADADPAVAEALQGIVDTAKELLETHRAPDG